VLVTLAERVLEPFGPTLPEDVIRLADRVFREIWSQLASGEPDGGSLKPVLDMWTRSKLPLRRDGVDGARNAAKEVTDDLIKGLVDNLDLTLLNESYLTVLSAVTRRMVMVEAGLADEVGSIMTPPRQRRARELYESLPEIQAELTYAECLLSFAESALRRNEGVDRDAFRAVCGVQGPTFIHLISVH
jgi:hypothetical protein